MGRNRYQGLRNSGWRIQDGLGWRGIFQDQYRELVIDKMDKFWWLCPMGELILDHESELGAHRIRDYGSWSSNFKDHLEKYDIKPILARVNHPQINGKLERFFGEYKKAGN